MITHQTPAEPSATFEADRHYFTPDQADRALVLVKRIAADIVRRYARLGDLQEALEIAAGPAGEDVRSELLDTIERLQTHLEELDDIGVELVDWSRGIVNFPAKVDGRCVLLCWEPGQDRITYWHEVEDGLAGRQPIETLPIDQPVATTPGR
jgi:hypothetical protein